jgi:hypothetical protein
VRSCRQPEDLRRRENKTPAPATVVISCRDFESEIFPVKLASKKDFANLGA